MKYVRKFSQPARYYPFLDGRYRVRAGLHKIQVDFGNGTADQHCIQLDRNYPEYRQEKIHSRNERLEKYVQVAQAGDDILNEAVDILTAILVKEYPDVFHLRASQDGGIQFHNRVTDEILTFTTAGQLVACTSNVQPPYTNVLDALACQIQEDIAIVSLDSSGNDHVCALHLCFPNYWSAEDKIGKSFLAVHDPVPGFEALGKNRERLLQTLAQQGPFVRFAWGLTTDRRLNHHPVPPVHYSKLDWCGRSFDPSTPELYIRTERQVTLPMPGNRGFIFLIRTYLEDVSLLSRHHKLALANAIRDMQEDTLRYKGLFDSREAVINWLEQ